MRVVQPVRLRLGVGRRPSFDTVSGNAPLTYRLRIGRRTTPKRVSSTESGEWG